MTIRHFKIFICVCDETTMTRAAAKMHMAQPSVSQAIRELEDYYRLQLFERLGRRLFLTAAGEKLLTYSRHIVNLHEQTEREMQNFGSVYRVRLGASVTIGESILIDLIKKMNRSHPRNQITSVIQNTSVLEKMLLSDALDIVLIEGHVQSEYLFVEPFCHDELVFVAAPDYFLLRRGEITCEDLPAASFYVREEGSGTRKLLEEVLHENRVKINISGVYNNAEAIKKAVGAGLGVSVISKLAVKDEVAEGKLVIFKVGTLSFQREFSIVYHKNKYLSQEIKHIIVLCKDWRETV